MSDSILKGFFLTILLILTGCGGSSSGGAGGIPSSSPNGKIWALELIGDNVGFTMNLVADQGDADEEFLSVGPVTIGVGQTAVYSVDGRNLDSAAVTRVSGVNVGMGGPWLMMTLYENGVPVESQQLSSNGTFVTFNPR